MWQWKGIPKKAATGFLARAGRGISFFFWDGKSLFFRCEERWEGRVLATLLGIRCGTLSYIGKNEKKTEAEYD